MSNPRKPFYRLEEICARWQMSEWDIASYVLAEELVISAVVTGLQLDHGTLRDDAPGDVVRLPAGSRRHTGPIELTPSDGWHVIQDGERCVNQFRAAPNCYSELSRKADSDVGLVVRRVALVFGHAEIERFEAANGLNPAVVPPVIVTSIRRGPPPQFDWDRFWVEVCHLLYVDGVPKTQGELIRRMDRWFSEHAEKPPATSTVKKKLIPLWRLINPEALASAP